MASSSWSRRLVHEFFIKTLRFYPHSIQEFIDYYMHMLESLASLPNFVCFEPRQPVLRGLVPRARAVLFTFFENPRLYSRHVAVLALHPFRFRLSHTLRCCNQGFDLLKLFLRLSGIRTVGFHRSFRDSESFSKKLKEEFPDIKVYGSQSYDAFRRVVKASSASL